MKKPEPLKRVVLDWLECVKYLEEKYNFKLRDYAGRYTFKDGNRDLSRFNELLEKILNREGVSQKDKDLFQLDLCGKENDPQYKEHLELRKKIYEMHEKELPPYQDFWHLICDWCEVSNGGTICLSNESLSICKEDWQKTIMEYILSEFGQEEQRECRFLTEW